MSTIDKIFFSTSESILVKYIKREILDDGFVGVVVTGRQRIGKTRYVFRVMKKVLEDEKIRRWVIERYGAIDDDWWFIARHTKFDLDDLVNFLRKEEPVPKVFTLWDDAGVHANKYKYFQEDGIELTDLLSEVLDLAGTHVKALIITTPSFKKLLTPLREYDGWIRVKIYKVSRLIRLARIYMMDEDISGKMRFIFLGEDKYNIARGIPSYFWVQYNNLRHQWANVALDKLNRAIAEKRQKISTRSHI